MQIDKFLQKIAEELNKNNTIVDKVSDSQLETNRLLDTNLKSQKELTDSIKSISIVKPAKQSLSPTKTPFDPLAVSKEQRDAEAFIEEKKTNKLLEDILDALGTKGLGGMTEVKEKSFIKGLMENLLGETFGHLLSNGIMKAFSGGLPLLISTLGLGTLATTLSALTLALIPVAALVEQWKTGNNFINKFVQSAMDKQSKLNAYGEPIIAAPDTGRMEAAKIIVESKAESIYGKDFLKESSEGVRSSLEMLDNYVRSVNTGFQGALISAHGTGEATDYSVSKEKIEQLRQQAIEDYIKLYPSVTKEEASKNITTDTILSKLYNELSSGMFEGMQVIIEKNNSDKNYVVHIGEDIKETDKEEDLRKIIEDETKKYRELNRIETGKELTPIQRKEVESNLFKINYKDTDRSIGQEILQAHNERLLKNVNNAQKIMLANKQEVNKELHLIPDVSKTTPLATKAQEVLQPINTQEASQQPVMVRGGDTITTIVNSGLNGLFNSYQTNYVMASDFGVRK